MSRHQLQPTCAATAMCAKVLRLASAASHAATLPLNSWLATASLGLFHSTSTGSGTAPNCLTILSRNSVGSFAFGTRSAMVSSLDVYLFGHEDTARPANVTTTPTAHRPSAGTGRQSLAHLPQTSTSSNSVPSSA